MARHEKHKTRQFDSSYPLALVEATPMEYKPTPKLMDVFRYLHKKHWISHRTRLCRLAPAMQEHSSSKHLPPMPSAPSPPQKDRLPYIDI